MKEDPIQKGILEEKIRMSTLCERIAGGVERVQGMNATIVSVLERTLSPLARVAPCIGKACGRSQRMLTILEKLEKGEVMVNLPVTEHDDDEIGLADIHALLLEQREKDYEIVFFNYPNDGTFATIAAGDTVLDFRAGTIKIPDGTVASMSSNLLKKHKTFLRSASIYATKTLAIQFDEDDKIPMLGDHWLTQNHQQFTKITLTTTEDTTVLVSVSTSPKTAVTTTGDSLTTIGNMSTSFGADIYSSLVTDDAAQFTDALAQGDGEMEVLSGLLTRKALILDVRISSKQDLNYLLWIFGSASSGFVGLFSIDMTSAVWYNGIYYKTVNINSLYTGDVPTMYAILINLDATGKLAGADGAITMDFSYKVLA